MQIHELTKLQKQLEEGLLDGVKAAIGTAKTGASNGGGVGGAIKALASPRAYQQARNDVYAADSQKKLASIAKDMNKRKKPGEADWIPPGEKGYEAQQAAKKVANNPQVAQQIDDLTIQFQNTFGAMPAKGKQLKVELQSPGQPQPSIYFKNDKGIWTNEDGIKITKADTITTLDKLIDGGKAEEVSAATAPVIEGSSNIRKARRAGMNQQTKKLPLDDFDQWALATIPNIKQAQQDPTSNAEIHSLATQIKSATDVKKATPLFKKLATVVAATSNTQGSMSGGYNNYSNGAIAGDQTQIAANFIDLIKNSPGNTGLLRALRNDPPRGKTGSNTLDAALRDAKVLAEELKAFKAGK